MARILVLALALLFVIVMGALTVVVLTSEGITAGGLVLIAVSVFVIFIMGVGIVGALGKRGKP
jgi:hypothetical protein